MEKQIEKPVDKLEEKQAGKKSAFSMFKNFAHEQVSSKILNPLAEKAEILKIQALEKL